MSEVLEYNPLVAEIHANPYPCYQYIRSHTPIHWNELLGVWMVMRYSDVENLYKDNRLSSQRVTALLKKVPESIREQITPFSSSVALWMLFQDPPTHTRLRGLVSKAFTPRFTETLRSSVESITSQLVEAFLDKRSCDIIADLAYPLPVIVIAELLGVEQQDRDYLKKWSDGIAALIATPQPSPEIALAANQCVAELNDYFRDIIKQRRKNPREDLISRLVKAEEEQQIDENELLATCTVLLFGGHETTTNLIGNSVLALIKHPQQLQKLQTDPSLINSAVEEMLRYDSPVQWNTRVAKQDLEIAGVNIAKGQVVMLVIGSANRDPERFEEPDRFDVSRKENKHLAFGHSSHFCLGAALARLEGQIAMRILLEKLSDLQLATDEFCWRKDLGLRGLTTLPVSFCPNR